MSSQKKSTPKKSLNQISVRLSSDIKSQIEKIALYETRSTSQQIEHFIKKGIENYLKKNPNIDNNKALEPDNRGPKKESIHISIRLNTETKQMLEQIASMETRSISQQIEHFVKIGIKNYYNNNPKLQNTLLHDLIKLGGIIIEVNKALKSSQGQLLLQNKINDPK
ncbi:MAG: hypothetical protein AB1782_04065 [Cyanobacteriota bacterium]